MICEGWEGSTVDGRFPLLEWLGGWADQCVFLTVRQGAQPATVKLLVAAGAVADRYVAGWEAVRSLTHPFLVPLMETGRFSMHGTDIVFALSERAETFLSNLIPREVLHPDRAREILDPVIEALLFLHEKGVIHGSLKPRNVVLTGNQWKLAADEIGDGKVPARDLDTYDAPEVRSGELLPASDAWSLGIILVEAFAQKTPLWDLDAKSDLGAPDWLPEPFREIAKGCLCWEPRARLSMGEIKALLDRFESQPVVAVPAQVPEPEQGPANSAPVAAPASQVPVQEMLPAAAPSKLEPPAEESRPAPAVHHDSFARFEPAELMPRSRLFADLDEEDQTESHRGPILLGLVVLLVIAAIVGLRYRSELFHSGAAGSPPASAERNQPPSSPPATQPAPGPAAGSGPAAGPGPAAGSDSGPAATPTAPGPTPPPASNGQGQSATGDTSPAENPAHPAQSAESGARDNTASSPPSSPAKEPAEQSGGSPQPSSARGAVLKQVDPYVAPGARASMRSPVEVEVRLSVDEDGKVRNAQLVTHGPGNYFARVARQAAQAWRFTAPRSGGQAQASEWMLLFRFDRRHTEVTATELQ